MGVANVVGSLAVLGGTGFYVLREGRTHVAARSARLIQWVAPLAAAVAAPCAGVVFGMAVTPV
jgi:hypothetical protein